MKRASASGPISADSDSTASMGIRGLEYPRERKGEAGKGWNRGGIVGDVGDAGGKARG